MYSLSVYVIVFISFCEFLSLLESSSNEYCHPEDLIVIDSFYQVINMHRIFNSVTFFLRG